VKNCERRWGIAGDIEIDGKNRAKASRGHKALAKNSSRNGAGAYRQYPFRVWHRFIRFQ
jgi:hypothetical protein